jgi:hypothetical protein
MVEDQPKWRTGKICLGSYQQPGLAEAEEENQHG